MFLNEHYICLFLIQVFILLLAARAMGELFTRWSLPSIMGEILVGIILGPTILGRFFPVIYKLIFPDNALQWNMLDTVAWFGVLFMLLETGMEIDFSVAWRQKGSSLIIAISGIIIPITILSILTAVYLPDKYLVSVDRRIPFAIFLATVMTISAMPIATRMLRELNLLKTEMGFLIVSALAVNDIIGWVVFSIVLGFFAKSDIKVWSILLFIVFSIGFSSLALIFGKRISTVILDFCSKKGMNETSTSFTFACLLGMIFGAFSVKIGLSALFGFFIAGIVIGEAKGLSENTRSTISQMVYALFVPLFFASIGLRIDFISNFDPLLVCFILFLGCFGRFFGAWVGTRISRIPRINRGLISLAHVPGGMMEIVIALVAYQSGLITEKVFVAIIFSGVFSSIIIGPVMKLSLNIRKKIRLISFIPDSLILNDIVDADRDLAIKSIAAKIGEYMKLTKNDISGISQKMIERENEYSTALGMELAIPHIRLAGKKSPVVAFARLQHPVEWNSPDMLPVKYVFMIITPLGINDVHVQLLASIAKAMLIKNNVERLSIARNEEVKNILGDIFTVTKQVQVS